MEEDLKSCVVTTPETNFGEVAGMLTSIGAWLDSCENNDGTLEIQTRIPVVRVQEFRGWLEDATHGKGRFSESV